MGVSWVFESLNSASCVEKQLEVAGADSLGGYSVDATPYTPSEQGISHFYLLHHSNFPQSAFSIAHSGDFKGSARSSFDRGFDLILQKLNSGLKADLSGRFEVTGKELSLKDFRIRVGSVTQNTVAKGTIVEVEYPPSCIASQALPILVDFIEHFFPHELEKRPEVLKRTAPEPYGALETLYQYSLIFSEMRKRA